MVTVPVVLAPFVAILIISWYIYQILNARSKSKSSDGQIAALQELLRYEALDNQRRVLLSQSREPETVLCPHCHSPVTLTGTTLRPDGSIICTSCFTRFSKE